MIKSPFQQGTQGILAGMPERTMATVVAKSNGIGESDIQAQWSGDCGGYLSYFEGVGQSSSLMVIGKHKHLGFAGKATKGRGVQYSVSISFKTGPPLVGLFGT
jgi:hypothetical protein